MQLAPLSNRLPTGPGSRGGTIHTPEGLSAYNRNWRSSHPEYQAREALRLRNRRFRAAELRAPMPTLTDALHALVEAEVKATTMRSTARSLGLTHTVVKRWLDGAGVTSETLDAVFVHYGISNVIRSWRSLAAAAKNEEVQRRGR